MKSVHSKNPPPKTLENKNLSTERIQVFCRLKPCLGSPCLSVISRHSVLLIPPGPSKIHHAGSSKKAVYTFKEVFDWNVSQKEIFDTVALPLVNSLIEGANGLLFTYGVTGSGKTYTMIGGPQYGGIMPRCLDVLFNSISAHLAKKFTFKPDKVNGFHCQSEVDALRSRQQEFLKSCHIRPPQTAKMHLNPKLQFCDPEPDCTQKVSQKNVIYAVFVTFIEIYNNCVYDLLEESPENMPHKRAMQLKILREDAKKNMYVHGATEVEVQSPEEALQLLNKGQKKKQVANTSMNSGSSRSHSVFTIRLVQATVDHLSNIVHNGNCGIVVSQLSLVDLAGSERTSRTKNSGLRLIEAGKINNSLMTLRSCLEILRENHLTGGNKQVPYRNCKLTHLLKTYFNGESEVRMVICVNPQQEDFDENLLVLKFSEISQDVPITCPTPVHLNLGFFSDSMTANQTSGAAVQHSKLVDLNANIPQDNDLIFSLTPDFPCMDIQGANGRQVIGDLKSFMEESVKCRCSLQKSLNLKQEQMRAMLMKVEKDSISTKQENKILQAELEDECNKNHSLQRKVASLNTNLLLLQRNMCERGEQLKILHEEKADREMALSQSAQDKEKVKQRYHAKIAVEKQKLLHNMERKLEKDRQISSQLILESEERFRRVKEAVGEAGPSQSGSLMNSSSVIPFKVTASQIHIDSRLPLHNTQRTSVGPNSRRRSRSDDRTGHWLDHCPATEASLVADFEPSVKKRKSLSKLIDVQDSKHTDLFCLTTQEQNAGELETRVHKD